MASQPISTRASPVSRASSGAGEGYNLNLAMANVANEADFMALLEVVLAAVKDFGTEVLVLSLGFNIYELDSQSKVSVTTEGFARLGEQTRALHLPCLIVKEGHHVESLEAHTRAFFADVDDWQ